MSTFSAALNRLKTGFYNSLPFAPTNLGGLAADGHVKNFPAALKDTAELMAVMETWIATLGGDDLTAVRDFADALIETDRTFNVWTGFSEILTQTVVNGAQGIYLGRITTGSWELIQTDSGSSAYEGGRVFIEKTYGSTVANTQISIWTGYIDASSFHGVAVNAYEMDIFAVIQNYRAVGLDITANWAWVGGSTIAQEFSRPAGILIPVLDASNEIKVGLKIVKNTPPTIGHDGVITNTGLAAGGIGSFVFAKNISGATAIVHGGEYWGSGLKSSSTAKNTGTALSGTWRALSDVDVGEVGLFMRIL